MNSDIKQAINIITQRIANLQQIKQMLLDEFSGSGTATAGVRVTAALPGNTPSRRKNGKKSETRKDELVKFLTNHGPSKRAKILAETHIPKGTVASLLNQNDFVRRSDGTWDLRDANTEAIQ